MTLWRRGEFALDVVRPAMRRGRYKKSEASRQQVLDAAIQALADGGYAKTSVSHIATRAGMSKGAVHYHFESKDELMAEVLERCATVMRDRVRAAWQAPGEPAEKIRRALRELRDSRRQGAPELRVLADFMAQSLHDEKLRSALATMFEANRQEVLEQLAGSLEQLGLKPRIPIEVVPRLLLGALDGLALHDFFDPPSAAEDANVQQALEVIALSLFET